MKQRGRRTSILAGALLLAHGILVPHAHSDVVPAGQERAGTGRATTSDSGDMHERLRWRLDQALGESGHRFDSRGGFHWVVLVQVAQYEDDSVRNTNRRRGLEYLIDDLIASRKSWPREQVGDTLSIIPYHFNLLDEPGQRQRPLRDFLDDPARLKSLVPDESQADVYGDGVRYSDGHDWRRALMQTADWLKKTGSLRNSIVVVLDWNNLVQPPQRPVSGPPRVGEARFLIREDANPRGWKEFQNTLREAGFPQKNLETILVGNLEYDVAVFTPGNLEPIPTAVEPVDDEGTGEREPNWLVTFVLVSLLAAGGVLLRQGLMPHGIQIDGQPFLLKAFGNASLDIAGPDGKSGSQTYVLPLNKAPAAGRHVLARLKVDLLGRMHASGAHYRVQAGSGCRQRKDGGVDITGRTSTLELHDRDGHVILLKISRR